MKDFSPGSSRVERVTVAGSSGEKSLAVNAANIKSKATASRAPGSKASFSELAPSTTWSHKVLAASLFPETVAETSKAAVMYKAAAKAAPKVARTSSGAQKRPAPEPELEPSDEAGGEERTKKRIKKTRKVLETERSEDQKGDTVRNTVEVEKVYSTDESEDDRAKPSKVSKTSLAKAAGAASRSTAPAKSASNPAPAEPKPSGSRANRAGKRRSAAAGTKKPTDKRQLTLERFFKKK